MVSSGAIDAVVFECSSVSIAVAGLRAPAIENLAVTQDSFDAIDLSDNSIQKLENLPRLLKLRMLLLSNNRISSIETGVADMIPNLDVLVLTNNKLSLLTDLEEVCKLKRLTVLMLIGNPVQKRDQYRQFVIHHCPVLHLLDGQRVTESERTESHKFFKSKKGKAFLAELTKRAQSKQTSASSGSSAAAAPAPVAAPPVLQHAAAVHFQEALSRAASAEEVEALKRAYEQGKLQEYLAAQRVEGSATAEAGIPSS